MTSKIRVLDDHTINKIAAGEVIENPASVVKELVENSLDAGSKDICVEIKGGGRELIRVSDNGSGMSFDDALLSLERHATSKIRAVEDIQELITMGFRGEAIPSIASISKFSLLTKEAASEGKDGSLILVEGGKILKACSAACSPGTTIEVKTLFFNVPVRKKFQKSPAYDSNEILKIMTILALGHPSIKFRLISNQETILSAPLPLSSTPIEQLKERIEAVLGSSFIENCIPIEAAKDDTLVYGWIGTPFQHRQNRTGQHTYINQRGVQSPLVSYSVKDGYGTTIPPQRHPIYVLQLTIPGSLVDVNVHPQKREVRLRQEQTLREMLVESVREGIQKMGGVLESFAEPLPAYTTTPFIQEPHSFPTSLSFKEPQHHFSLPEPAPSPPSLKALESLQELPLSLDSAKKTAPLVIATIPGFLILDRQIDDAPHSRNGLCLVDQRAAHARVIYEKLCRQEKQKPIDSEPLLIPHTIELTPCEALSLKRHLTTLENLGIYLKEFGRHSFLLDSLPKVMGKIDPTVFIKETLGHLNECDDGAFVREHLDRLISFSAVRASVSKGKRLSLAEGQALIEQLCECETPKCCPLGKPVWKTMSSEDLNKHFN